MKKRAQEEMLGFVLIIIIVAIIILAFISLSIRKPPKDSVESYEMNNFIQVFLQYTSECEKNYEANFITIQDLIPRCYNKDDCLQGDSCEILKETLKGIIDASWEVKEDSYVNGYILDISADREIVRLEKGELTGNCRGGIQTITSSSIKYNITFTACAS